MLIFLHLNKHFNLNLRSAREHAGHEQQGHQIDGGHMCCQRGWAQESDDQGTNLPKPPGQGKSWFFSLPTACENDVVKPELNPTEDGRLWVQFGHSEVNQDVK